MSPFTLRGPDGMEARIAALGGILMSLRVPDRHGRVDDVVLGHPDVARYRPNPAYLGAIVGRYANRIARGRFPLDGRTIEVTRNENGANHLHGGRRGFDAVEWDAEPVTDARGDGLVLRRLSPDGEEGFPGALDVTVRYTLTPGRELVVDYHATTDAPTVLNLTHHSYFNLSGRGAGDVLGHVLEIPATRFTPVAFDLIPTGEAREVLGTPLDFRVPTPLGARIGADHPQIRVAGGYDHNFVLDGADAAEEDGLRLHRAATLFDPASGRQLVIRTSEPGLQLYSGNGLPAPFGPRAGVALETQHFPDAPNHAHFPSTVLRPGEVFRSRTVHAFTTRDG